MDDGTWEAEFEHKQPAILHLIYFLHPAAKIYTYYPHIAHADNII